MSAIDQNKDIRRDCLMYFPCPKETLQFPETRHSSVEVKGAFFCSSKRVQGSDFDPLVMCVTHSISASTSKKELRLELK